MSIITPSRLFGEACGALATPPLPTPAHGGRGASKSPSRKATNGRTGGKGRGKGGKGGSKGGGRQASFARQD